MPADKPHIGMGRRRQGDTDPARTDDRNRSVDRALDAEAALEAADSEHEPGHPAGAHGAAAPHRNVRPGTRLDLEQTDVSE